MVSAKEEVSKWSCCYWKSHLQINQCKIKTVYICVLCDWYLPGNSKWFPCDIYCNVLLYTSIPIVLCVVVKYLNDTGLIFYPQDVSNTTPTPRPGRSPLGDELWWVYTQLYTPFPGVRKLQGHRAFEMVPAYKKR